MKKWSRRHLPKRLERVGEGRKGRKEEEEHTISFGRFLFFFVLLVPYHQTSTEMKNLPDSVLTKLFLLGAPPPILLFLVNEETLSSSSSSPSSLRSGARFSLLLKKSSPKSTLPPKLDRVFLIGEGEAIEVEQGCPALEAVEAEDTERGRLKDEDGGVRAEAGREREEEARVIRVGVEDMLAGKKAKG